MSKKEQYLKQIISELLYRGRFDPFLPIDDIRAFSVPRPDRNYDEQAEWEAKLHQMAEMEAAHGI